MTRQEKANAFGRLKITNSRGRIQGQVPRLVASQGVWGELIDRHGFSSPEDDQQSWLQVIASIVNVPELHT